jgi:hypothetical protein
MKISKFQAASIVIGFLALGIIGNIIYRHQTKIALKDYNIVSAKIVEINPTRGNIIIHVEYMIKGNKIKNDFAVTQDSFRVKDEVLLKVSKKYADKYIEFIRKIHN